MPLERTQPPEPPGTLNSTENAPRGQPRALKSIQEANGVWMYLPARRNIGDEKFDHTIYAADIIALLYDGIEQWGEGHAITQGEIEQAIVDKYREYWGPADLAMHKNWPQWKHDLHAAKIALSRTGKITTGREYRSSPNYKPSKGKWWAWVKLRDESETPFQG